MERWAFHNYQKSGWSCRERKKRKKKEKNKVFPQGRIKAFPVRPATPTMNLNFTTDLVVVTLNLVVYSTSFMYTFVAVPISYVFEPYLSVDEVGVIPFIVSL